jgi:hypothetical protein
MIRQGGFGPADGRHPIVNICHQRVGLRLGAFRCSQMPPVLNGLPCFTATP